MSQENVEIVRQLNRAFNRGDIEALVALLGEEIAIEGVNNAPDLPPVVYGKEGARRLFAAWVEAFDELRIEIEESIDAGDHVVCVVKYYGKNQRSGLTVDDTGVDVWQVRDGKCVRGTLGYADREVALEAVGLSEQDAHADS